MATIDDLITLVNTIPAKLDKFVSRPGDQP